jgi:3-deoxy-D-arabino-heptulosonate 7-phosphate (DAHP) synthase
MLGIICSNYFESCKGSRAVKESITMLKEKTVAVAEGVIVGGETAVLMAGPCSVENYAQTEGGGGSGGARRRANFARRGL